MSFQSWGVGPCAVILAGGPGIDPDYMIPVARRVAHDGYRALLLAQRGTGRSADVGAARMTMRGSIADIEDLRRHASCEKITLVGHSFGTAVAQAYASEHPTRVAALILISSVGTSLSNPPRPTDGWRQRIDQAERDKYDAFRRSGNRVEASEIKFRASFHDPKVGRRFLERYPIAPARPDFAAKLSKSYAREFDLSERPAVNDISVWIIMGRDDSIRGYEPMLKAHYPQMKLQLICNTGHFPWVERPDETWKALDAALAR